MISLNVLWGDHVRRSVPAGATDTNLISEICNRQSAEVVESTVKYIMKCALDLRLKFVDFEHRIEDARS